jgi:hypothetical protein
LTWRISTNNRAKPGDVVGCKNRSGHWVGHIDGATYVLHRIIWLWMTRQNPPHEIDHKNTISSDNRWENLRAATSSQNHGNFGLSRRSTSGCKGVTRHKPTGKWFVKIAKDGRQMYLGLFVDLDDAVAAYKAKAVELFGEFARAA